MFFLAAESPSHAKLVMMYFLFFFLQRLLICLDLCGKGHWQGPKILTKNKKEIGLVAKGLP